MGNTMWHFKSCDKCNGDLVAAGDEWHCIQCGKYYYPKPSPSETLAALAQLNILSTPSLLSSGAKRHRRSSWAGEGINRVLQSQSRREHRWWSKHREVVQHLKAGMTVNDIAVLTGHSQRQVRQIRERLQESCAEELALQAV
jgi:hypothetical protein